MPGQPPMQAIRTAHRLSIERTDRRALRPLAPSFVVRMHPPSRAVLAQEGAGNFRRFAGSALPSHACVRCAPRRTLPCFGLTEADVQAVAAGDHSFVATILTLLRDRSASLALAEACTGGLMADLITDVPGCSAILHGSVVAYDNAAKTNVLGVKTTTLSAYGAVSEQAVVEMAQGARRVMGSTYGLAVSGIAGPSGATSRKPVGTTWFALAWEGGTTTKLLTLPYDRRGHKLWGACNGLELLRRHLLCQPATPPRQT